MFDIEAPLITMSPVDNSTIVTLTPNIEKDKWDNAISEMAIQERGHNARSFRIVHHPSKVNWRSSATIYGGRDRFLRYSTYSPDNDMVEHTATVITAIGEFSVSYGDGDFLRLDVPEGIKENSAFSSIVSVIATQIPSNQCDGSFERFLNAIVPFILEIELVTNRNVWLSKAEWEALKLQYQANRQERRSK